MLLPFLRVLDKARMNAEAKGYLSQLSVSIDDMTRPVERLSGGQRQAVAISRALRWKAEIIIMDEPTAALGVRETAMVLALVRTLRAAGRTVLLISHSMRDVVSPADRVVIMGAGRKIADRPAAGLSADDLSHLIMLRPRARPEHDDADHHRHRSRLGRRRRPAARLRCACKFGHPRDHHGGRQRAGRSDVGARPTRQRRSRLR